MSHNPHLTSKDTNDRNDHEEGCGEDRAIHVDPDIDMVDVVVVPSLDVDGVDH